MTWEPTVSVVRLTLDGTAHRALVAADLEGDADRVRAGVAEGAVDVDGLAIVADRVATSSTGEEASSLGGGVVDDRLQRRIERLPNGFLTACSACPSVSVRHGLCLTLNPIDFDTVYQRAALRKGGEQALEAMLSQPKSSAALRRVRDDRALAEMTACVFRSGFVWRVIESKWPNFELAFSEFDVTSCAMLSDEDIAELVQDSSIVRHAKKIESVRRNARFLLEVREEHGSFGKLLAGWPTADFVELWQLLKKRGDRLGGQTGRYLLRFLGWDSPILSRDVVRALIDAAVIDKEPTSLNDQRAVQEAFVQLSEQSGRSNTELSRILAMSVDS